MYRFDRADSPTESRDDVPPTPDLSSSAQSPQSITLPSTTTSTTDEHVHSSIPIKTLPSVSEGVKIEDDTS